MNKPLVKESAIVSYFIVGVICVAIALSAIHWAVALGFMGCFFVTVAVVCQMDVMAKQKADSTKNTDPE